MGIRAERQVFSQLFMSSPKLPIMFYNSLETLKICYFFEKTPRQNKENNLFKLINKMFSARAVIMSTAHASSVFLMNDKNMILNQSAQVLSFGYFSKFKLRYILQHGCTVHTCMSPTAGLEGVLLHS